MTLVPIWDALTTDEVRIEPYDYHKFHSLHQTCVAEFELRWHAKLQVLVELAQTLVMMVFLCSLIGGKTVSDEQAESLYRALKK